MAAGQHVALEVGRDVERERVVAVVEAAIGCGRADDRRRRELRRKNAAAMRADSGDASSSTIAIGTLCSVSGRAVAAT
jgi:hypothetical protein